MPHIPKAVTHPFRPRQLSSQGAVLRPELVAFGSRPPQAKKSMPVRKPVKEATDPGWVPKISMMNYDGPETEPDQVFKDLFGTGIAENDKGVLSQ